MLKLLTTNYALILANVALVLCLGQLWTKFLKRVGYENFLYKGCLDRKGGVKMKRVGSNLTAYSINRSRHAHI